MKKLDKDPQIVNADGWFYGDAAGFAMNKYAYYMCYKCGEPYYGGEAQCAAAAWNTEFKCRYCCTIAVWFFFGTTHFCEPCHNNNSVLTSKKKEDLVQCPCKPKDRHGMLEKLKDTNKCPLGLKHPPHGEVFCLGCVLCRNKDFWDILFSQKYYCNFSFCLMLILSELPEDTHAMSKLTDHNCRLNDGRFLTMRLA